MSNKFAAVPAGDRLPPDAGAPVPVRHDRSRAATAGWLALIVLVGGTAYGAGTHVATEREAEATSVARAALVPTVRTVRVQRQTEAVPLDLPGSVEPIETAAINARASGYVMKRLVDIGGIVKAGAVMAVALHPRPDQSRQDRDPRAPGRSR